MMISLGQSASESAEGQKRDRLAVSTKKPASALSGGAIKPKISTGLPLSATSLSDSSSPRTPEALYISSKRTFSPAQAVCRLAQRDLIAAIARRLLAHHRSSAGSIADAELKYPAGTEGHPVAGAQGPATTSCLRRLRGSESSSLGRPGQAPGRGRRGQDSKADLRRGPLISRRRTELPYSAGRAPMR